MKIKRIPRKFKLGAEYTFSYGYNTSYSCKFIQVTQKGYNFLNLETNKCMLRHHLYLSKYENHLSEDWFWINSSFIINKKN